MNTFGSHIQITFSGESHSDFLTVLMEGLPKGLALDEVLIRENLRKRRPKSDLETARVEMDEYEILTGVENGVTTGEGLMFKVPNRNVRPHDYDKMKYIPRPGHADYPAFVKNPDYFEKTGGGMYSGRLTVLFSIVGSIAQQILREKGICVVSHIAQIGSIEDRKFNPIHIEEEVIARLGASDFPLLDEAQAEPMRQAIRRAKSELDSIGGIMESAIVGLPAGCGNPWFDSVESHLSHLLFSIPSIKGVEFGDGFSFGSKNGSHVSDEYIYQKDGRVTTLSNHNGGILGGLTTGMPLIVRTVAKPTSSIGIPQRSVHLKTKENVMVSVEGRHDPCIALRAVHVVNAVLYYGILDLLAGDGLQ